MPVHYNSVYVAKQAYDISFQYSTRFFRAIFLLEIFKPKLFFIYSLHAACTTHLKFLHSVILIILWDEYEF
jgi:hypothetical protein